MKRRGVRHGTLWLKAMRSYSRQVRPAIFMSASAAPLLHSGNYADELALLALPLIIMVALWALTRRQDDEPDDEAPGEE